MTTQLEIDWDTSIETFNEKDFEKTQVTLIVKKEKVVDNSKIINQLKKSAQSLINQSEKINTGVSGNWTHRRQSFADNAQKKKDRLIKNSIALNRLADLWEINECPEILKNVRSVNDLHAYYPRPIENRDGDWYIADYPKLLKKVLSLGVRNKSEADEFNKAVTELSEIVLTPEQIKERKLNEALKKVRSYNIQGFFPTPDAVIDKMIDYALIKEDDIILEPSAGIGSIPDRLRLKGFKNEITCVEQQYSLSELIALKGYNVVTDDILNIRDKTQTYDVILMNPPFEKGQDMEHVVHCWNTFLKDSGTLVSIMSAGVTSNTTKKHEDFRNWVADRNGYFIDLGQVFKDSFNSTGVSTKMLVIHNQL